MAVRAVEVAEEFSTNKRVSRSHVSRFRSKANALADCPIYRTSGS